MSSRQSQKEAARQARLERERRERVSAQRRRRVVMVAAALASCLVVGGAALLALGGSHTSKPPASAQIPPYRIHDLDQAVKAAGARVISHDYAFGINDHTDKPVTYPMNPPTNGAHAFAPAQDGSYVGTEAPSTESVVHAQEHGRIVIQYRPGLSAAKIAQLQALFDEAPHHVLLVENRTQMPCEAAATAWGHGVLCPRLTSKSFDALRAFRDTYVDKGPETAA